MAEANTLFLDALGSDVNDIQGGTTGEGIHLGVMTGTCEIAAFRFLGLDTSQDIPKISNPTLPDGIDSIAHRFIFRGDHFDFKLESNKLWIKPTGTDTKETSSCTSNSRIARNACLG